MRILILNYEFPPLGGGAGNATYHLLKEFVRYADFEIDLVTSSVDGAKIENFSPRITIYYLDVGKKGNDLLSQGYKNLLLYSWKAYWKAKSLIAERNHALVHSFFGVPCGYVAMKLGLPYIVSLRGSDVPGHNPEFTRIYSLSHGIIKKVWMKALALIANSEDLKKESEEFLSLHYKVIPNGVDTSFFKPCHKKDDVFRVLYAGRLHRVKNIDLLIRSYSELLKSGVKRKSELIIVGDGPDQRRLMQLARDLNLTRHVRFLGHRTKMELLDDYNQASVFVLLSENEGMSNTLLEAMACGLPVLATPTGGSREILQGNGIIVEKDMHAIAKQLRDLMDAPTKLREMEENSRKNAENMSWEIVALRYANIYRSHLNQTDVPEMGNLLSGRVAHY